MAPEDNPWTRGGIVFSRSVLDRVFEEARAAYGRDEESCGLIFGPAADALVADEIVPMENRANRLHALDPESYPRTGRTYFDIDPLKVSRLVREGEERGRPAKVLYHSHLDVGAYFSDTDAVAATGGGKAPTYPFAYLVTSVRGGAVDDARLFVWDAGQNAFVPSEFHVT